MELSEKLKNARIHHKITQKTLAETLGVSRATLSYWESGQAFPSVQYLRRYQELFNFESGYFDEISSSFSQKISFDVSNLNSKGILALKNFYNSLILKEEYSKKA